MYTYIYGSYGQDGRILFSLISSLNPHHNTILVSRSSYSVYTYGSLEASYQLSDAYQLATISIDLFRLYPPSFIYYFAAVHYSSFDNPYLHDHAYMQYVNSDLPILLADFLCTESIKHPVSFVYASTSLIFGNSVDCPQTELTTPNPCCTYSSQKYLTSLHLSSLLSKSPHYLYIAILYNHESIYRKPQFFTFKLHRYISNLVAGIPNHSKLVLHNPEQFIDMGYASEFVLAIHALSTCYHSPGSYIFSTFSQLTISEYVNASFTFHGFEPQDFVVYHSSTPRSNNTLYGINHKLLNVLGFPPMTYGKELAKMLSHDHLQISLNQNRGLQPN